MALLVVRVLLNLLGPPITILPTAKTRGGENSRFESDREAADRLLLFEAPGKVFPYFGYSFEVPWNASFKTRKSPDRSTKSGIVRLKFDSGQNLLLIAPANQTGLLTELVQDQSLHMENLRPIFGDLMNRSAYDQYSALLNTSPSTIRAFGPRSEAVRGVTPLTIKSIALPASLETGAFAFNYPTSAGSKSVTLEKRNVSIWKFLM